jgi:hypothetical protein
MSQKSTERVAAIFRNPTYIIWAYRRLPNELESETRIQDAPQCRNMP